MSLLTIDTETDDRTFTEKHSGRKCRDYGSELLYLQGALVDVCEQTLCEDERGYYDTDAIRRSLKRMAEIIAAALATPPCGD